MLKNLSFLALAGAISFAATGCIVVTDDSTTDEIGDGDGDATTTGDGDGDQTGDGDGDQTGDGDGDQTGDGDGDQTGDGDGEPAAMCGWDDANMYFGCGFEGDDPSGTNPTACPDGLVDGDPCGTVTGVGCCDADGNNWYCTQDSTLFMQDCSA